VNVRTVGIISDTVTSCLLFVVCVLLFKVGRQMKRGATMQKEIQAAILKHATQQQFVNAAEAFRIACLERAVFGHVTPDSEPPTEAVH
jgi:hypothetical protein